AALLRHDRRHVDAVAQDRRAVAGRDHLLEAVRDEEHRAAALAPVPHRVDHRADVYAVGAILYTMLTGQRPFDADTPAQTLLAVIAGAPLPPRDLEPTLPEPLERVILRAMDRDPEKRFATMDELAQALARRITRSSG